MSWCFEWQIPAAGPTGAISNANCTFGLQDFNKIVTTTCTGIGQTFYATGIVFIVMSFIGFVGTFMLFCLARRFTLEEVKKIDIYKRNAKENV